MKNKIFFLTTAAFSLLAGCSDDLNLYPTTEFTSNTFYQNEQQIALAVDDVYRQLGNHYDSRGLPALFGELRSDNAYILQTAAGNDFLQQISDFNVTANNGLIQVAWEQSYSAINICNNLLYQLENNVVEIEASEAAFMEAQVLTIRSLIYFNMVRAWGAVPFVDRRIGPEEAYDFQRTDSSTIYGNLINDLNFAKETLPEAYTGNDIGRVTKYSAAAILAKIYFKTGDMTAAQSELEFIINSGFYSLDANNDGEVNLNDYLFLFEPDTKNSKSSILEVQYLSGDNAFNSNHQIDYAPWSFDYYLPGQTRTFRGSGINTPTEDLAEEFENNDPRTSTTIRPGFTVISTGEFLAYPSTMKFYDPNFERAGQNFEIIRYADILLMYAEITNDAQYLNMVRERVGLAPFGTSDYPFEEYPTLQLAIEHERRVELAFEFHRFFDLVRTGRAIEVMSEYGYEINENQFLFPIPLNEIDINPDIEQNPGY
ncbi:RagB/SusD family nutrient uptake outer membrane protein [uncultured Salegentibacter sp.]|uniref:RagB/SusD family nutrient uptake outer membrane protein n=1 Tax=uncultured Salegentibacter sp. TaxID=259320 RepID=UPI0030DAB5F8